MFEAGRMYSLIRDACLVKGGPTSHETRAHAQALVDFALQIFTFVLFDLFAKQRDAREGIKDQVTHGKKGSLARRALSDLLRQERSLVDLIRNRKEGFDRLLAAAKELGFEVFEREEERLTLYYVLAVSYQEILDGLKRKEFEENIEQVSEV
jgi:hypothetical protein